MARGQLLALGMSDDAIVARARRGWLRPIHRGVYAVGRNDLADRGRWMAAVLASDAGLGLPTGSGLAETVSSASAVRRVHRRPAVDDGPVAEPRVLLSHYSAAALHGMLPARDRAGVEITTAFSRRPRPGIRSHRSSRLAGAGTWRDGIPCTTVARTLVDIAASGNDAAFERAWSSAASRRLLRRAEIERELASSPTRPGAPAVAAALAADMDYLAQVTRSELERAALRLCRDFGLPRPHANRLVRIADRTIEADLLWPEPRLIVEVDGGATHRHAAAKRRDRDRDSALREAGWRTIRIAESALALDRSAVAERIRAAIADPRAAVRAPGSGSR